MTSLILCILVSTVIGFIFKLYPRYRVDTFQAIVVNYSVCVVMAWATVGEFPIEADFYQQAYFPYAIFLGVLFICTFNLVALTIQKFGVTLTTIMQKMSLILTVPIAIWMYDEGINFFKIIGLLAGVLAILFSNYLQKEDYDRMKNLPRWMLILPTVVLLACFFMEVTLQYVEENVLSKSGDPKFVATVFAIAHTIGMTIIFGGFLIRLFRSLNARNEQAKKLHFSLRQSFRNIAGGIALGMPNFYSIYLILKSIGEGWDGSVFFPINNVAIIALSALIAYLFFNEKLSKINIAGVLLAIASIGLIAFGSSSFTG